MKDFKHTQEAELTSWFSDDPKVNRDKEQREEIRYPLLKKQMGLDNLDTRDMVVADIGCGPYLGVSRFINCKRVDRFDPLIEEYKKHYPQQNGYAIQAELIKERLGKYDLIISTNAVDHFDSPKDFLHDLITFTKPGCYVAMLHAIDNAYSHPHEAHAHNINPELIHEYLDADFEFVWELDYQHDNLVYGWRKQPAHAFLARKLTGY